MKNFTKNSQQGFTLIELLIAMAISLVVLTSLSSAFISQRKTFDAQAQVTEMIQGARAVMDMISREVKMAGYNPTGATIVSIPYNATQLEIRADLNGDGDTSDANEDIIYTYDSGTKQIKRDAGGDEQILAENIDNFEFIYWDGNAGAVKVTSATDEGNIRQIEIKIVTRTSKEDPNYSHPTESDGYRRYTLSSYVTPPNLGL